MDESRMCTFSGEGDLFRITVRKTAKKIHLTQDEEDNIRCWVEHRLSLDGKKRFLTQQIMEFINAVIIKSPDKYLDAYNYSYENYLFRRFQLKDQESFFEATEEHCKKIAAWLKEQHIKKHTHEKQRIKIINQGQYFLLKAKDISLYERLAHSRIRQESLQKHKFIAFLTIEDGRCKDVTDDALSMSKLQFTVEALKD